MKKRIAIRRKGGILICRNVAEDVIYDKLFIEKHHTKSVIEKNIADSGAISHMVKLEENMINLKDSETRVIIEDSRTLTGTKMAIGMAIRDVKEKSIV